MIILDWKNRLTEDTNDFFERKLSANDYEFEIIYNAYPQRQHGKIPKEVVTFVAKILAERISKKPDEYLDFIKFCRDNKGENGKIMFTVIVSKTMKQDADMIFSLLNEKYLEEKDTGSLALINDKLILPLLKKNLFPYLENVISWFRSGGAEQKKQIIKMLIKLCKISEDNLSAVFNRMESLWLYADKDREAIDAHADFLKSIGKINKNFYLEIFARYSLTRTPVFIEILCGSVNFFDESLYQLAEHWAESGNSRIKKSAVIAQKILKRKRK
ncbi:MAG: hypothetical protein CSB55_02320 [Candidatus Cloacimonadota bacterium]|nr:MAG: hypothetical protein CSB55_02320 [Candidatus Cloacimonadota bacterium]